MLTAIPLADCVANYGLTVANCVAHYVVLLQLVSAVAPRKAKVVLKLRSFYLLRQAQLVLQRLDRQRR